MPSSSIARPSKIYPNLKFWFENKPSGNPGLLLNHPSFTVKLVTEVNHGSLFKQDAESFFSDPENKPWVNFPIS
jgi:hypothetical protein